MAGGTSFDSIAHGWAPIPAPPIRCASTSNQSETREVIFLLGYQENPVLEKFDPPGSQTINKRGTEPVLEHWLSPQAAEEGLAALRAYWDDSLAALSVDTPDADTNRMVNIWNPYQNMVTFNLSRIDPRRSSREPAAAWASAIRARTCSAVSARSRTARESGSSRPRGKPGAPREGPTIEYQPLTKRGNHGIGSGFNDDPLWLILAVCAYVKETGDAGILEALAPYEQRAG